MLETADLILDKAKPSDWRAMYKNVWSRPESARYMEWSVTTGEEDAKLRIQRTIAFQQVHDTWLVYEKTSGEAIGFAGVERTGERTFEEAGVCLGPAYWRKGYGRQIVQRLMRYCKEDFGAEEFFYFSRWENEPSRRLALSLGFRLVGSEERTDPRDGSAYVMERYRMEL